MGLLEVLHFAQFSRFLREGFQVIGTDDNGSVAGYDPKGKRLVLITVNHDTPQKIRYDLGTLKTVGKQAAPVVRRLGRLRRPPRSVTPMA